MSSSHSGPGVQNYVFAAILIALFILVCRLFAPFFTMLLWSVLFYILFSPLHQKVVAKLDRETLKGKIMHNIWAGAFSLGTAILILIPLSFVAFQFFRQVTDLVNLARNYMSSRMETDVNALLFSISDLLEDISSGQIKISPDEMRARIYSFISSGMQNILQITSAFAKNVGTFFMSMVFMVFSLFFFYVDGAYLSRLFLHIIPIKTEYINALVGKFKDIIKNLVQGYIFVAMVQALMAFIIFSIFRITGALVFSTLVFIGASIPMVGAAIVWFPLGLVMLLNGSILRGLVFLAVSGIFISTIDNVLRPMFLRDRIQLHPLIIFFAILGGVYAFGFNGVILGPMIVILFLTVLDLFLTEHKIQQG